MIDGTNLFSAFLGAVIGAALSHLFNSWRDTKNKRREIILVNLIEIYEAFDASPLIDPLTEKLRIESAVAKIQLFGDDKLITLCRDFCDKIARDGSANTTILMSHLWEMVRSELRLPNTSKDFTILRFNEIDRVASPTTKSRPKTKVPPVSL